MYSNVCFNKTAVRRLRMGALPWLRRWCKTGVTVTVAALAFITTMAAPQAYADYPMYPGEMCIKWTGAGIPTYYYGSIGNASTTDWLYLDCPLVNDWYNYGAIDASYVKVKDRHPSADISCTLYNVTFHNTATYVRSSGPITSSSSGSSGQAWLFQFAPVAAETVAYFSANYFSCAIPPSYGNYRSSIVLYSNKK